MSLDFTLARYRELCGVIAASGRPVVTIEQFLLGGRMPSNGILLRHDVDRRPASAVAIAQAEESAGLTSTFYFRVSPSLFSPAVISAVCDMGHDAGYHCEALSRSRGDRATARALFARELAALRAVTPIATVSAHGSPLSPHNNLTFLTDELLTDNYLAGTAESCVAGGSGYYFSDTGRRWDGNTAANVRDRVSSLPLPAAVRSTAELEAFIRATPHGVIMISAHPNRWSETTAGWTGNLLFDLAANAAKIALAPFRRRNTLS